VATRSAFFFHGHLQPAELANFNVQNVPLRDRKGGRVELMSNGIAVWWPSRPRAEFLDLAGAAGAWFLTTASAYYLETSIPLEPHLEGWVEALDVTANEAMIGFADPRFVKVRPPEPNATVNADMLTAVEVARALRRAGGEIERAAHELLAAANDGTAQSFLSAYRALECVRRIYEPQWRNRARGWALMRGDLAISLGQDFRLLESAARAVRHGDVPARVSARHAVNQARSRRQALLNFTRATILAAVWKHT
jgi:hypothetical protein